MFSKTYLKQAAGQAKDSERLRNRLARRAWDQTGQNDEARSAFVRLVEQETGARIPQNYGYDIEGFFRDAKMRDVLDGVTCMAAALHRQYSNDMRNWIEFCQRAFTEEGMAYRVDDDGTVHYVVDTAFQETADSVVAVLSKEPFVAAGACITKAVHTMTQATPDGKHAIRDAFEGVETVFKIVTKAGGDLTEKNIAALLTPIVDRRFPDTDPVAKGAAQHIVGQLKDWTNACHKYRRGHGSDEPVEPPLELAIALVGNGLNFARWLTSLA
jgi:hypothetical protein